MRVKRSFFLLFLLLLLSGCISTSSPRETRSYRDPVTYSFEAYTPYPEEKDPLEQFLTGVQESTRQIREWEEKYLW